MKSLIMIVCFASAIIQTNAQDTTKQTIKTIIDSKHFSFEPINMTTGRGGIKQLTPGYFFEVNGDTLKTYLPYIGRAYTAPIKPSDAGFNFTTTDYTYSTTQGKKNSYIINLKTKRNVNSMEFSLTVYGNGNAYLTANSSDKDPASYNGKIKVKK
ncbi:MAG: DUF4251 domain-containing protein [Parafilimonas sp.]